MSFIQVGDIVRIYYDSDCFDEGEVISVGDVVTVDLYDWIECWHEWEFTLNELYYEGIEVLEPITRGTIVVDFHPTTS